MARIGDKNRELRDIAEDFKDYILPPFDYLVSIIGFDAVCDFSDEFCGTTIYVPSKRTIFGGCIEKQMQSEFNGGNYADLARKYGYTERNVRLIISGRRKKTQRSQGA